MHVYASRLKKHMFCGPASRHVYDISTRLPPARSAATSADVTRGWQRSASRALDDFGDRALPRELDPASAAMLDSQAGPYAARVFTARPTSPELCLPSPLCRALLLRRLRMPLPLAPAACRCLFSLCVSDLFRPIRGPSARHDGKPNSKATRDTLRKSKAGKIHGWKKSRAHGEARRGSRLASGGAEKVSARTSLRSSAAPSTLAAFPSGRERRLAATARAAANESKAHQRET